MIMNHHTNPRKRKPLFPQLLYTMLERAEVCDYAHIISWMPDGRSFKIHVDPSCSRQNDEELSDSNNSNEQENKSNSKTTVVLEILARNGFKQKRYKSFLRQLQLYGFSRTFLGPRRGECAHPFLLRGRPDLLVGKSIHDFQKCSDDAVGVVPLHKRVGGGYGGRVGDGLGERVIPFDLAHFLRTSGSNSELKKNEGSATVPTKTGDVCHLREPRSQSPPPESISMEELFLTNDHYNYWMPSISSLSNCHDDRDNDETNKYKGAF